VRALLNLHQLDLIFNECTPPPPASYFLSNLGRLSLASDCAGLHIEHAGAIVPSSFPSNVIAFLAWTFDSSLTIELAFTEPPVAPDTVALALRTMVEALERAVTEGGPPLVARDVIGMGDY